MISGLFLFLFGGLLLLLLLLLSNQLVSRLTFLNSLFGKTVAQILLVGIIVFLAVTFFRGFDNPGTLVGEYSNLRNGKELIELELKSNGNFNLEYSYCSSKDLKGEWIYSGGDLYDYVVFELNNGKKFKATVDREDLVFDSVVIKNCKAIQVRLVPSGE